MKKITLINGDGISREIVAALKRVFSELNLSIEWDEYEAGEAYYKKTGRLYDAEMLKSIEENKVAIKGPITTPIGTGFRSINVFLRQSLDLYANIRPISSINGVKTRYDNLRLTIFRENSEGLYLGDEVQDGRDTARAIKLVTRSASKRILKLAFEHAMTTTSKKIAVVTKANILKFTDGLFLDEARNIAKEYSGLEYKEVLIDNMCMQLVMRPQQYETVVTMNLYGDILSDLCAGLVGGLGLSSSANIGKKAAIFEPVHGSAPDIAGKGVANPSALLFSGAMLLEHIGEKDASSRLANAVSLALSNPDLHTADLGGSASTEVFTDAVCNAL